MSGTHLHIKGILEVTTEQDHMSVLLCHQRLSGRYITLLLVTGLEPRGGDVVTDVFPVVEHPRRMTRVCTQTQSAHGQLDSVVPYARAQV